MAGWDFTADSSLQLELSGRLNKGADNFDTKIGELYGQIDSLGAHWVGEDYDAYKTGADGYKTALQDLSDGIRMFGKHFENLSTGTEGLAGELANLILNATGSGGAGGTGTQSGTGSPSGTGSQAGDTNTGGTGTQTGNGDQNTGGDGSQTGNGDQSTGGDGSQTGNGNQSTGGDGSQNTGGTNDHGNTGGNEGTVTSTTYKSGDMIEINGEGYSYYGSVRKPNNELVDLVTKYNPDTQKNELYYRNADGSVTRAKASTVNGNGQTVTYDATVGDIGASRTINAHGYNVDVGVNVDIDGILITSGNKDKLIASSVTYSGVEGLPTNTGVSGGPSHNSQVTYTSDGSTLDSFTSGYDGGTVNGYTLVKATGLQYITSNAKEGVVIQIPQGTDLQWDPAWNVNGYDFDTKNNPIYLSWDSTAASGKGAFHIVDEYGNVINNKDFTLDGFNNDAGHWK